MDFGLVFTRPKYRKSNGILQKIIKTFKKYYKEQSYLIMIHIYFYTPENAKKTLIIITTVFKKSKYLNNTSMSIKITTTIL